MADTPWQVRLSRKSLKKSEKLRVLDHSLPTFDGARCLEVGCDRGVTSYHLRRRGGRWVSVDTEAVHVRETHELVGRGVVQIEPLRLPFRDGAFQCVAVVDFLEHVEEDAAFLRELGRVLAPGGSLYVTVPRSDERLVINRLKELVGMTPALYGHVRHGYTVPELRSKVESLGFRVTTVRTYSRFFTELVELALNVLYLRLLARRHREEGLEEHGAISPASGQAFRRHRLAFALYSGVYPLVRLLALLDRPALAEGCCFLLHAQKTAR
ncbi:MAG TPA: methyltransferase domain-containing protein [Methylomirabilota bacterium]|nr:methyltransferase domain-containing protein [Methylomirabilota bacterium]